MALFSLVNLVASASIAGTSEDPNYPAQNLGRATRPDNPAKTLALGEQRFTWDYGAAKSVVVWGVFYTNFATVRIQANDADEWSDPEWDSGALTIGVNPGNGRYCHFLRPSEAKTASLNSLLIPAQATTDGADQYRIGAVWAVEEGELSERRGLRYDDELKPVAPVTDTMTASERRQRINRGPRFMHLSGEAFARVGAIPLMNDDAAAVMALEGRWWERDGALYIRRADHPAWIGVMRQVLLPAWRIGLTLATSRFEWEEITGP
jgi:hypothetical protein